MVIGSNLVTLFDGASGNSLIFQHVRDQRWFAYVPPLGATIFHPE